MNESHTLDSKNQANKNNPKTEGYPIGNFSGLENLKITSNTSLNVTEGR